jgi:hypothetical protein
MAIKSEMSSQLSSTYWEVPTILRLMNKNFLLKYKFMDKAN